MTGKGGGPSQTEPHLDQEPQRSPNERQAGVPFFMAASIEESLRFNVEGGLRDDEEVDRRGLASLVCKDASNLSRSYLTRNCGCKALVGNGWGLHLSRTGRIQLDLTATLTAEETVLNPTACLEVHTRKNSSSDHALRGPSSPHQKLYTGSWP